MKVMRLFQHALLLGLAMSMIARGHALAEPAPSADHAKPEPTAPAPRHSAAWKWTLGAAAAITVSGVAFTYYARSRVQRETDKFDLMAINSGFPSRAVTSEDCGKTPGELATTHNVTLNADAFERACSWTTRGRIGQAAAGVAMIAAVISIIVLSRDPAPDDAQVKAAHSKSTVAVVPVVTPGGGGASLSLTW